MALIKLVGTPMWLGMPHMYSCLGLGKAPEKPNRNRASRGCFWRVRLIATPMSMILVEMYLLVRKPRCPGRQNLFAMGVNMALRSEAMVRLSVLTTEIGRKLAGV